MSELTTERLHLRPLRATDLDAILAIYHDPRAEKWIGPHTREEVAAELEFYARHEAEHGWAPLAVEDRASGALIGDCGLVPLELRGPEIELMYDLDPDYWGRGLASEAAGAVMADAFTITGATTIIAVVRADNPASIRVLEKTGFRPAGTTFAYDEELLRYERSRAD
ncbi:MAG TPA: GNAT family N-acetyltransferase [Solirubrobacteraceae bacterium]|nr:GNAT family N-acetyltransferase [Solirubrobacteraceae bacterium]